MFGIEKFLIDFNLEAGGALIGWMSIAISILYIIAYSGTLGFIFLEMISQLEFMKEHTSKLRKI